MRSALLRLAATTGAVTVVSALGAVVVAAPASAATTRSSVAGIAARGTAVHSGDNADDDCWCDHHGDKSDDWTDGNRCDDDNEGLLGGLLDNVLGIDV